ncbi:MAG TPA: serine/threonine-protein kinase [Bryobacteraceae bacterium]|nr:serine/threonine-protein kinase [Bryobacteraceae bacterium]
MPDSRLIGPVLPSTPADPGITRSQTRALPYDLLEEASGRLKIMAVLAAVLWLLGTVLDHLALRAMTHGDPSWNDFKTTDAIAVLCAFVSLGLLLYARRFNPHPRFILDLGLVYMVFNCLALGLTRYWDPTPAARQVFPIISWVGAVVLMAAAILPNTPGKTLVASLIAASMNPLGLLVAKARGVWDEGPASSALVIHYPDLLLAGVAVVISHVVTKLGQQVTKAREMGSYRLVKPLGKGGMGEVWQARHRMLARDSAIKLIHPEAMSRNSGRHAQLLRRRFEQEAKATAALRSPHTVELYDFGVTEDGVFYYVMELLDGIDLDTLVKRFGPQPPARVVWIMRQVCRSLADAHLHGMVHRDIKPTNIFICRMGTECDFVKVLDFGLVKVMDGHGLDLTGEGATTGTPAYIAPEVAMGNPDLDGRADLYGLGCVGYWLLTGGLVFEEKGAAAMMLAHLRKEPVPPSERSELHVPASLDRIILKCLAKEPAERFSGAEALARALADCDGVGSWIAEDAESWWRAHLPEGLTVADGGGKLLEEPTAAA